MSYLRTRIIEIPSFFFDCCFLGVTSVSFVVSFFPLAAGAKPSSLSSVSL
jgi:hypothetical protein